MPTPSAMPTARTAWSVLPPISSVCLLAPAVSPVPMPALRDCPHAPTAPLVILQLPAARSPVMYAHPDTMHRGVDWLHVWHVALATIRLPPLSPLVLHVPLVAPTLPLVNPPAHSAWLDTGVTSAISNARPAQRVAAVLILSRVQVLPHVWTAMPDSPILPQVRVHVSDALLAPSQTPLDWSNATSALLVNMPRLSSRLPVLCATTAVPPTWSAR